MWAVFDLGNKKTGCLDSVDACEQLVCYVTFVVKWEGDLYFQMGLFSWRGLHEKSLHLHQDSYEYYGGCLCWQVLNLVALQLVCVFAFAMVCIVSFSSSISLVCVLCHIYSFVLDGKIVTVAWFVLHVLPAALLWRYRFINIVVVLLPVWYKIIFGNGEELRLSALGRSEAGDRSQMKSSMGCFLQQPVVQTGRSQQLLEGS